MRLMRCLVLALLVSLPVAALAWKGAGAGNVQPISAVIANAEEGDILTIEGQVVDSTTGSGSLMVVTFDDGSGQVPVAVPDSQLRQLDARMGEASGGQRYRVTGRWAHKLGDTETWGLYAQKIERIQNP